MILDVRGAAKKGRGADGQQFPQIEIKKKHTHRLCRNDCPVLCDLPFSRNQPLLTTSATEFSKIK
jgi:hypothetical protein